MVSTCFTACTGPTPCGFFPALAPGTVQFLADKVLIGNDGMGNSLGLIAKLHSPGFDSQNATAQFKVTQFPQASGNMALIITDATGFGVFEVNLFMDGTLFVVVGSDQYNGTWTPAPGADIVVHYETIAGVPHLFIDGAEIPLVFFGINALFYAPNVILIGAESDVANAKSAWDFMFVDTEPLPPTTVFCCPDGVASR